MKKPKSLGKFYAGETRVVSFSGARGEVEVDITSLDGAKKIRITMCVNGGVFRLIELAQSMTEKQRVYALGQWHKYLSLKEKSGYKEPGETT